MNLGLQGKRAVVTGASRGIGLATSRLLAAEGCDVALVSRGGEALEQATAQLAAESDTRIVMATADTSSDESVAEMAQSVIEQLGGVDILVNGAARPSLAAIPESDLELELNIKVRGYLRCARAFAPGMADSGWGRIINISGLAARKTGSIVSAVRNVAVAAMTKNLAEELGPKGINVTVVHPGLTRTEATPGRLVFLGEKWGWTPQEVEDWMASLNTLDRLITAEEVAYVITFLASPLSISINGDAIATGGGEPGVIHY